jgi:steroid 5-alpha reductase family enzyme
MWWGIWIVSLSVIPEFWFVTIFLPLLITFLLIKVSGIPLLEARMSKHTDWPEYARRTNAFIPWFSKKS